MSDVEGEAMTEISEEYDTTLVEVGTTPVTVLRGGSGAPLLVLHDELGFPGWVQWNRELALNHELIIPLQPGFGVTPRVDWLRTYHDVASFYGRLMRELGFEAFDVIGFSAGGYIAAEMAAACPRSIRRLVLVAPLGIKPHTGEIADVMAMSIRSHIALTISNQDAPELGAIYGGAVSPEQFELFEAARAETCRLGWAPYLHNPSLPNLLEGVGDLPSWVVWGTEDKVLPRSAVETYASSIPGAQLVQLVGVGHRPEIEAPAEFLKIISDALAP
jgi:pimeloyl-ACP methyl ester carboxylesterase